MYPPPDWFQLVDSANVNPPREPVPVASSVNVPHAAKAKYSTIHQVLLPFRSWSARTSCFDKRYAVDKKEEPLKFSCPLDCHGKSGKCPSLSLLKLPTLPIYLIALLLISWNSLELNSASEMATTSLAMILQSSPSSSHLSGRTKNPDLYEIPYQIWHPHTDWTRSFQFHGRFSECQTRQSQI